MPRSKAKKFDCKLTKDETWQHIQDVFGNNENTTAVYKGYYF